MSGMRAIELGCGTGYVSAEEVPYPDGSFDFAVSESGANVDDRFAIPLAWAREWPSEQVWHLKKLVDAQRKPPSLH